MRAGLPDLTKPRYFTWVDRRYKQQGKEHSTLGLAHASISAFYQESAWEIWVAAGTVWHLLDHGEPGEHWKR